MNGVLLCEPNISEGRDRRLMDRLADSVRATDGVSLIHRSADRDHNRMVLAFAGTAERLLEALERLARLAVASIDMRRHAGQHPRIGAVDVVAFVAVPGRSPAEALKACRRFGRWLGSWGGIPAFFYGIAATRPEREALPNIRRGQFEGLAQKMSHPGWIPDEGPASPHLTAGATAVGVRAPLVRFNVNLDTADTAVARRIALRLRESAGGLPAVRALGLELRSRKMAQVSMNLLDYKVTSVPAVWNRTVELAADEGTRPVESEFIGPVPVRAYADLAGGGLHPDQMNLRMETSQLLDLEKLGDRDQFLTETA